MESNREIYKLSEFAHLMGVSTKSLQRWDKNGVLVADRTDGCHRFYTQEHIDKLNQLRKENSSKLTRQKNFSYEDLTGRRFGKLVVIKRVDDWIGANGHRHIQWECVCDCGNHVVVKGASLRSGYNKSCGCFRYGDNETKRMWEEYHNLTEEDAEHILNNISVKKPTVAVVPKSQKYSRAFQDLTGCQFGLWTVLYRAETRHYRSGGQAICWRCRCVCGNEKSVPGRDLKSGASQSCGCMSHMSWSEYYVKQYLDEHGYSYDYQKKYFDLQGIGGKLLSYDFLVKNRDGSPMIVIECQGEQHYRPIKIFGGAKKLLRQQIHDRLKLNYAEQVLKVPLYEISYMCGTKESIYEVLQSYGL